MPIFKKPIFVALSLFSIMGQANASTVTFNLGAPQSGLLETFDELPLGSNNGSFLLPTINGQLTLNNAQIVQGSVTNQYAAPYLDTTQYVSVYGNGTATLSLNQPTNYFGIDWSSVDTFNTLNFYNGNTLIGSFSGQTIMADANFANQSAFGTVYANFDSTEAFTKVIASSSINSFEFDNVRVSAVPLPASLPMFGAAILGLGALGLRGRKRLATTA